MGNVKSVHLHKWARYMADQGQEVHVISYEPVGPEGLELDYSGVTLHLIKKWKGLGELDFIRRVLATKRILKEIKPDIGDAHYAFGYGLLATCAGFHPFMVNAMGSDIGSGPEKSIIMKTAVRRVLKKADLVSVKDGPAERRAMELGCEKTKIIIRPSYCNTDHFAPGARSDQLIRKLHLDKGPSVLYARRIGKYYKSNVLKKAIPRVVKQVPEVRFVIFERGPALTDFKEFVESRGLQGNVVFVPEVSQGEMPVYLASVDLYVDTFYAENEVGGHGHGTNTVEAMSCGCPQLLPDRDEYKEPWFHATLYRRGDSDSLAEQMVAVLRDEKLRKELGIASREAAVRVADEKAIMRGALLHYASLIDKYT